MIPPAFKVEVSATRVGVHFEEFLPALQQRLEVVIGRLTQRLVAQVKALEPRRTGRLQSLTRSYVDTRDRFVRGRVRVLRTRDHNTAAAAGALEYGAHRRFTVRAHRRGSAPVRTYQRQANITAQRFLRGPAASMLPIARAEIERAINQAVAEANRS